MSLRCKACNEPASITDKRTGDAWCLLCAEAIHSELKPELETHEQEELESWEQLFEIVGKEDLAHVPKVYLESEEEHMEE